MVFFLGGCFSATTEPSSGNASNKQEQFQAGAITSQISNESARASHARMLEALQQIADRTDDENPYLGDRAARELRAEYERLSDDASEYDRCQMLRLLGYHELVLGNTRKAIEYLAVFDELIQKNADKIGPAYRLKASYLLGTSYLRLGETENCCLMNTSESCIMPIRGGGIHTRTDGSRSAVVHFTRLLEQLPEKAELYLQAQWLLNIAYMTLGEYPNGVPVKWRISPDVFSSQGTFPRFRNIAPKLGLDAFDLSGGMVVDDFDNDGYLDVLTSTWDTRGGMHFYHNNRDGSFTERTVEANLDGLRGGLNMVQADYDNDGDVDVLVLRGAWLNEAGRHPNSLLRNNGNLTFTDVTFAAGLAEASFPTQTAGWADYDNDGDLDLYVGNETTTQLTAPSQLFRNNGHGRFTDVAAQAGVENRRISKGVSWGDYNNDRFPDLYVSNLDGPNRLYRNQGDGTFEDVAELDGVVRPRASFPCWFWDVNNDGVLDLYVTSYPRAIAKVAASYLGIPTDAELACLYVGDGNGRFAEVSQHWNLRRLTDPMGSNFGDLDNDGYLDFYLGTGYSDYEALAPNVMYRNREGRQFVDVTFSGGFGHLQKGHAVAFADLDNDGDQDVIEQMGGAFPGDKSNNVLYENPGLGNHWLTVKLVGTGTNRCAIGVRIRADIFENGKRRSVYKWVNSGGSFGANPLRQSIGLGQAERIEVLEIYWPTTDKTQRFSNVAADQFIEITEGKTDFRKRPWKKLSFRKINTTDDK